MATPNYKVNYDDKRFAEVETDKKQALSEIEKTYSGMINSSDAYYQAQIDAAKEWEETQKKNQQAQTDFAIEKIEQQKEQAQKDYTKEQSGAYVDWQKQSGQYGVNAEKTAAAGLAGTGYAESSQVSMYNTYQARVTAARESYNQAVLNYNNAIKDARLKNNAALAEIAYQALQKQLELSLEGFQYKNQLILDKANKKTETENTYYGRYQDVLKQINTENALAEEVRQYNEKMAEEKRQYNQSYALQQAELQLQKDKFSYQKAQDAAAKAKVVSGGGGGGSTNKSSSSSSKKKYGNSKIKGETNRGSGVKKTSSSGKAKSQATIDMDSVLKLGYGPISASRLSELENQGLIQSYQSGNKIKFRKSSYAIKQSMLFK